VGSGRTARADPRGSDRGDQARRRELSPRKLRPLNKISRCDSADDRGSCRLSLRLSQSATTSAERRLTSVQAPTKIRLSVRLRLPPSRVLLRSRLGRRLDLRLQRVVGRRVVGPSARHRRRDSGRSRLLDPAVDSARNAKASTPPERCPPHLVIHPRGDRARGLRVDRLRGDDACDGCTYRSRDLRRRDWPLHAGLNAMRYWAAMGEVTSTSATATRLAVAALQTIVQVEPAVLRPYS
jgi:hypothetical protein